MEHSTHSPETECMGHINKDQACGSPLCSNCVLNGTVTAVKDINDAFGVMKFISDEDEDSNGTHREPEEEHEEEFREGDSQIRNPTNPNKINNDDANHNIRKSKTKFIIHKFPIPAHPRGNLKLVNLEFSFSFPSPSSSSPPTRPPHTDRHT